MCLIEDAIAKIDDKIEKEVAKAAKKLATALMLSFSAIPILGVLQHKKERDELHERYSKAMNENDLAELKQIILDYDIVCPISGTKNWTDVRQFNLMFKTEMGSTPPMEQ